MALWWRRDNLPCDFHTSGGVEFLHSKQSIQVSFPISRVDQIHMTDNRFNTGLPFRFFIGGQTRNFKLIRPPVGSQVPNATPVIGNHRDIKSIEYRAIAKQEIPVIVAGGLNLWSIAAKLEAEGGIRIVIDAVLSMAS